MEGAANTELLAHLRKVLGVSKTDLELVRGDTGRRKTVAVAGLSWRFIVDKLGLGLALAAILPLCTGCPAIVNEVEIGILFPDDDDALQTVDNVSVTLTPDGFSETFAADGLDFGLEVELEPDETPRELSVFLARGETLLAWGRTPPFTYRGAEGSGIRVFAAYPGALTTFPLTFALQEDELLATSVPLRGLVALTQDGTTAFLDAYSLDFESATPLTSERSLPSADDGTLVGDRFGGANRLAWREGLTGFRFEVALNAWSELRLDEAPAEHARPGASWLHDTQTDRFFVFGGGDRSDVLQIELGSADPPVSEHPSWTLDAPRSGARASWLRYDDRPSTPILFGGDEAVPAVYLVARAQAVGPTDDWSGAACVQLDPDDRDPVRVLCAGGTRAAQPTGDALLITAPRAGDAVVQDLPAWLPVPLADPIWLADDVAVYAQGEGRLLRVDRESVAVEDVAAPSLRARGGQAVPFDRGVTFLVGGIDVDGRVLEQWQVFSPPPT